MSVLWFKRLYVDFHFLIIHSLFQAFMIATLIKDYAEVLRETLGGNAVSGGPPPSGLMAAPVPQEVGIPPPPPEHRRSRPPSIMSRPPPTLTEEVVTQ